MHPINCRCVVCMVDRSSLGTPEAKALRESVSDEQVARVMARAKELNAESAAQPTPDVETLDEAIRTARVAQSDFARDLMARAVLASDWLAADRARERTEGAREALYAARDDLYTGMGPDAYADADIQYGEWLGNRADHLGAPDA